jgi:nucleotide-binding universal stress UspA family protein
MFKRILVPVDGSSTSSLGIAAAIRLAKEQGARIRLIHVVDELVLMSSPEAGMMLGEAIDMLRDSGKDILAKAVARVRKADVVAETTLVESVGGRAADLIVRDAKKWKADIIVIGTHGRRGLKRVVMGSDAEEVVRNTTIPVMLVRSPAKRGR